MKVIEVVLVITGCGKKNKTPTLMCSYGRLWSFVVVGGWLLVVYSCLLLVCGDLLVACGRLMVVCGCLCSFIVVACFSNCAIHELMILKVLTHCKRLTAFVIFEMIFVRSIFSID